jgi:nucleotide-binding universal stress UspA family protein
MDRIVVGVDGSAGAAKALAWAVEEAQLRRARVEVVTAWQPAFVDGFPYVTTELSPNELEGAAKSLVDDAIAEVRSGGVRIDGVVRCGSPASVLLDVARDATLLVVGTRGRGGFAGLLLGSVSHQVCSHAPCPVVVVPG